MNKIQLPITEQDIQSFEILDKVLISGTIYTARDKAHKKLIAMIEANQSLPFDLAESGIYYCGPSPAAPDKVCGAIGPTTSQRMDPFTPQLLEQGLKLMIGKGERSTELQQAIKAHGAVYLVTIGGAAALLAQYVQKCEVYYWPELGAEAIYRLEVIDFPCYVLNK
jgi:fumarate hydratase subunit beta